MSILKVESVDFSYGQIQALHSVSLDIDSAEIVAIVGANGAGKTTLINAISGVNRVSDGRIEFFGSATHEVAAHKLVGLGIVQVPEGRHLFPYLSVRDNLRLGAFHKGARASSSQNEERVYDLFPDLKKRRSQEAGSMSGGQQQMLAIGRGLMSEPKLLMLDEPSLGLAPIIVSQVFESILEIRSQGTALLIVEQNVQQALDIADHAYALQEGRVVLSGKSQELLSNENFTNVMLGVANIPDPEMSKR